MSNLPEAPRERSDDAGLKAAAGWFLTAQQRTLWLVPLAFPLAALSILLALRGTNEDAAANFEQSRKEMLATSPPEVPDEQNAAVDYRAAEKAYSPTRPSSAAEVKSFLKANAFALDLVRKGTRKAVCNWGMDSNGLKNRPDFTGPLLLNFLARERARDGDHAGAVAALRDCYATAQHAEADVWGFSEGAGSLADDAVMEIVFWETPGTSAEVMHYRNVVSKKRDARQRTLKHLQAAKAYRLYQLDGLACGAIPASAFGPSALFAPRPGSARMLLYASERQEFCKHMDALMDCARSGQWEQLSELERQFYGGSQIFTRFFISSRTSECLRADENRGRVLDTGLAFLQFRLKYGRDPVKLSELVPEFIPSVPTGVLSELPLRMYTDSITKDDQFSLEEFKQQYGDREVIRIASPDGATMTLPPLWNSKREAHAPAKPKERP